MIVAPIACIKIAERQRGQQDSTGDLHKGFVDHACHASARDVPQLRSTGTANV
jgi:hypothetical protein